MKNQKTIKFNEGSKTFKTETTTLNVTDGYVLFVLAKKYDQLEEQAPSKTPQPLWADVLISDELVNRYSYSRKNGLTVLK
jgi:hypothetical protein